MKKHFLISYTWRIKGNEVINYSNKVIDHHPLQWIKDCKSYDNEIYALLNWSEITEEQYHEYKDIIN